MNHRKDYLSSDRIDGVWHARYPGATLTLCLQPAPPPDDRGRGRRMAPDCPTCVRVSEAFDRIDGSVPDHWGWKRTRNRRPVAA